MVIYNTLSEKKEELEKPSKKELRLFVCGPTVYDHSHIGHARTYIAFDVIANYLRSLGYKLFYLQNITDIDDKIINRANNEKKSAKKISSFFTKEYLKDVKSLGIKSVNKYSPASKYIKEIQQQISQLLDKGYAYTTSSGVYFEIKKFADYGKLSKQDLNAIHSGWRIEPDPEKKDPMDFVLWKFKKQHANSAPPPNGSGNAKAPMQIINEEPSWQSPWGGGRPGWHIEDTAITEKFFGPQYDLHGGAIDLKFPHHESEIAQQEAISGKQPMVRFWLHTGFVLVNGEKMSKSLNNFITIRDFLKNYSSDVLRYLIVSHHYRSPIDYSDNLAEQAKNAIANIMEFLTKLSIIKKSKKSAEELPIANFENKFQNAMNDDFNTPLAFAAIFNLINEINPKIWDLSKKDAKKIIKWTRGKLNTFKIAVKLPKIPLKIRFLAKKRELFRVHEQFTKADDLRKTINALGYSIEDTPEGPLILILNEQK